MDPNPTRRPLNAAVLSLAAAVAIWAPTFVIIKAVVDEVGPFTLTFLRFAIAFAVLAPIAVRKGLQLRDVIRPTILLAGLSGVTLYFGVLSVGLVYTGAGNAALIQAGVPALTALLSWTFLRERLSRRRVSGIFLSVVGVSLIVSLGPRVDGSLSILGNILVVISMVAWAAYLVQAKKISTRYSPLSAATAAIGAGTLILLPIAVAEIWARGAPEFSAQGLLAIAYLGVGGSALGFLLWSLALSRIDAIAAAPYMNLLPVAGLIVSLTVGEPTNVGQVLGGAVVLGAVWLANI